MRPRPRSLQIGHPGNGLWHLAHRILRCTPAPGDPNSYLSPDPVLAHALSEHSARDACPSSRSYLEPTSVMYCRLTSARPKPTSPPRSRTRYSRGSVSTRGVPAVRPCQHSLVYRSCHAWPQQMPSILAFRHAIILPSVFIRRSTVLVVRSSTECSRSNRKIRVMRKPMSSAVGNAAIMYWKHATFAGITMSTAEYSESPSPCILNRSSPVLQRWPTLGPAHIPPVVSGLQHPTQESARFAPPKTCST